MTIETLAKKNKLKLKKDDCGEMIIPGKLGHLYVYDDENIGALYFPKEPTKGWKHRREELIKAGATVKQNGDMEGSVIFPAQSADILKLACRLLGIPRRKARS